MGSYYDYVYPLHRLSSYGAKRYNVMITLIAESKTMIEKETQITPELYQKHIPVGEKTADNVMHMVAGLSVGEIADEIKISSTMAAKVKRMAYEFPNKSLGLPAIEAFSGVVFKALSYPTLSEDEKLRLDKNVMIISSLYGWLRPQDIIKSYRFDFTTRMAPGDLTFSQYWRKDVTIQLVKYLQNTNESDIINLLPADAAKSIDWKLVKRFAKVWKVDFKILEEGATLKTPPAGKLKELRGNLLRAIITHDITTPAELMSFASPQLLPLGTPDYPDHILFCI